MAHADDATKTWVSAIPTKNADGNVTEWKIQYRYTLTVGTEKGNVMQANGKYNDDFIKTFQKILVIENPSKAPNAYTKSELLSFGLFKSDNKFSANSLKSFTCLETFFCERSKYTSLKL